MIERLRTPAMAPPPIRIATPRSEAPGDWLAAHYRRVHAERMHDLPFVNPALGVAAVGFAREQGDWLGIMLTPWFLNLFLLPGGGTLWQDIAAGERRAVALPCGTLHFIADDDPDLGPYQYCPLIAPVSHLPEMSAALQVARDALTAVLTAPVVEAPVPPPASPALELSRRGFFRRLGGREAA